MAMSRSRGVGPVGVARAAVRLALLIGLGFGAGLLIGVISEEPALLLGHLRGEGESVPLTVAQPARAAAEKPAESTRPLEPLRAIPHSTAAASQSDRVALQRVLDDEEIVQVSALDGAFGMLKRHLDELARPVNVAHEILGLRAPTIDPAREFAVFVPRVLRQKPSGCLEVFARGSVGTGSSSEWPLTTQSGHL